MRGVVRAWAVVLSAMCSVQVVHAQAAEPSRTVELRDARWFDGTAFVRGSRFVRDGHFVERPRGGADSVITLAGAYVVPPFGDAHTHSPDGARDYEAIRQTYFDVGVFYVQTLANHRTARRELLPWLGRATELDVVFADAVVTATGGHPQILYELLATRYRPFWENDAERFEAFRSRTQDGQVYYRLDRLADVDSVVRLIARDAGPVLKIMLLQSDLHAERAGDSTFVGSYGLPPDAVAPLVRAAHQLGMRVWAHVETPADFAVALDAGVDAFAHVPGYGAADTPDSLLASLVLPDSLVRRAGAQRVQMTATAALGVAGAGVDTARVRRHAAVVQRNVRALAQAGVQFLVGSDNYNDARILRTEPRALARVLGQSPAALLRTWAVHTPQAIFPGRRIGVLAPGYEASALVLACDPLRELECLQRIQRWMKQGVWLPE
jgi:imidazolonepropionase-like amidohydrolase